MGESARRVFEPGYSARREYAVSKLAAETMLLGMGGDVRIVRPFNVAGPGQRAEGGFVVPRFLGQARDGLPLTVYAPGTQLRAFTHVLDIVDGIVRAGRPGVAGEWNLGNPDNACTVLELAREVIEVTGSDAGFRIVDPRELWPGFAEAPDKVPDPSAAMRDLGWRPTRDRLQTIIDAWRA